MYRCFPLASLLLIALFFVPCVQANPAETIAPLIGEETVAVIRIDLQKIDLQKIAKIVATTVQDTVNALELPEEQSQQINGGLQMGLMLGLPMIQGVLDKLIVEGKAEDAFVLLELDPENEQAPPICLVAIPVGDKGKEETNAIRVALKEYLQMQVNFVRHGFILGMYVASDEEKDEALVFAKLRFQKLDSVERPLLSDAFDRFADYPVQAIVIPTETLKSRIDMSGVPTDIEDDSPEAKLLLQLQEELVELFPAKLGWYGAACDLEKLDLLISIAMEDAATTARMNKVCGQLKTLVFKGLEQLSEEEMPLDVEMTRKVVDLFMPKLSGKTFDLQLNPELFLRNAELLSQFGAALMEMQETIQTDFNGIPGLTPLAP